MDDDRVRWDGRYADSTLADPRPPDALVDADLVRTIEVAARDGRVLDVASGMGPVTRWAARCGMDVVALDISGTAISRLEAAPERDRIDARRVDLDDGLPTGLGEFQLVVCQRFRDPAIISALPDHVAPGGVLVVTVLSEVGTESRGPFLAPPGELDRLLDRACSGWERLHRVEADGQASDVRRRPAGTDDSR